MKNGLSMQRTFDPAVWGREVEERDVAGREEAAVDGLLFVVVGVVVVGVVVEGGAVSSSGRTLGSSDLARAKITKFLRSFIFSNSRLREKVQFGSMLPQIFKQEWLIVTSQVLFKEYCKSRAANWLGLIKFENFTCSLKWTRMSSSRFW